ncbi:MAG TPA: response regulator, partial [Thermodesulfobacteriota bacterium]|nr:response regulator [Thermodesulfobacteriota bacterium]
VDDEESLVEAVSSMLERLGYRVTTALNASQALKIFEKYQDSLDLVITDQTMPGLTGIELAKRMLSVRKDLPIILCTGYSEAVSPEKAKSVGISEFVMKPVAKREVAETVRRVLDRSNSQESTD